MNAPAQSMAPDSLLRRVDRERSARKQAETLLVRKSAELYESLQYSEAAQKKLQLALWACQESFWEWHAHSDQYHIRAFKLDSEDERHWQGSPLVLLRCIHPEDIGNLQFHWMLAVHCGQERLEVSFRFRHHQQYWWMRLRGRVLARDRQGAALHIVGTIRDITRERQAEDSFHLMASAFSQSQEPMLVLSRELVISECNDAFLTMIDAPAKTACLGTPLARFIEEPACLSASFVQQQLNQEVTITCFSGHQVPVELSLALFEGEDQQVTYIIATLRDISERKKNEANLHYLAMHDELTGLKNRNGLQQAISELILHCKQFSMLFIDLDGFKRVNDTGGHKLGDAALLRVAEKLQNRFTNNEILTRWGGDEFVVILPNTCHELLEERCMSLIEAIEADKILTHDVELTLSASIGVAEYPIHGETVESLLQNADAAMYQAKLSGKGQVYLYEPGLLESMQEQVTMLCELRKVITERGLEFYVQGKYDAQGLLAGAELLCRWRSALHGEVPPDVFISMTENNGLDNLVGWLALETACDYLIVLQQQGKAVPLSINISATQLLNDNFADQALAICQAADISPKLIEIEITERIFIDDEALAFAALKRLQSNGFTVALDDFGAGFSALSYLRNFDFDVVKLDKSLVYNIHHDAKALALLKGVIAMLHGLDLGIVAEGIERAEYVAYLRQARVTQMQGFFFDEPAPFDQFLVKHNLNPARYNSKR